MSARFRGNSPSQNRKVIPEEIQRKEGEYKEALRRRNAKKKDFMEQYGYQVAIGSFGLLVFLAFFYTFTAKNTDPSVTLVNDQDFISTENNRGLAYTLGTNQQFDGMTLNEARDTFNTQLTTKQQLQECASRDSSSIIQDSYDFRTAFPQCVKQEVYQQERCASSYAIAAASAISDRLCRESNELTELSYQPLIDCDAQFSLGCKGGSVSRSFDYAKRNGLPSLSEYTSDSQCDSLQTLEKQTIEESCVSVKKEVIQREIQENGPVVAVIPVYREFLVYREGIFEVQANSSPFRSGQAIKIIGWGQDNNGRTYWIVENSWGVSWGEQGFARIYADQQELLIEQGTLAPIVAQRQQQEPEQQV